MCTCITFRANEFYFGRNLDLDVSFGERLLLRRETILFISGIFRIFRSTTP